VNIGSPQTAAQIESELKAKKQRRGELQRELEQVRHDIKNARSSFISGSGNAGDKLTQLQARGGVLQDSITELDTQIAQWTNALATATRSEEEVAAKAEYDRALAAYDAALADADNLLREFYESTLASRKETLIASIAAVHSAESGLERAGLQRDVRTSVVEHRRPHSGIRTFIADIERYVVGEDELRRRQKVLDQQQRETRQAQRPQQSTPAKPRVLSIEEHNARVEQMGRRELRMQLSAEGALRISERP